VIVLRDTSHFKEAEAARTEFIESAAHDLRNPLGVTLSSLIMLQDFVGLDDPSAAEIFQIALEAVNQMQDLLDDLVHLEHIATGEGFEPEQTEPYALLLEALVEWEPVIRGKDQTCTLDVPQSLPVVTVSPLWFRRAVGNYLSNASKYTQEGGQIVLHARAEEDELVIEVRDNGPGIPPEAQGRLFERFYRVPLTKEKVRGTGLGLAIVKSVAEAHGGRVYARSLPKQGSVFGIVLPLTPGDGPTAGKDRLDAG
jgi:signal transduction histidine kinase